MYENEIRTALELAFPQPEPTRLCLIGAALTGPVGVPVVVRPPFEELTLFTARVVDTMTIAHGATGAPAPLRFTPRDGVSTFRVVNGVETTAFIPGLTLTDRTLTFETAGGTALPFAQQSMDIGFSYTAVSSPLLLHDQLSIVPNEPVTVIRANGAHAFAVIDNAAPNTGKLLCVATSGGAEANAYTVTTFSTGPYAAMRHFLEFSGVTAGLPFSLIMLMGTSISGTFTSAFASLGALSLAINAQAVLQGVPITTYATVGTEPMAIATSTSETFAGGIDGLTASCESAEDDWNTAVTAALGAFDGSTFIPALNLSVYDIVHAPVYRL